LSLSGFLLIEQLLITDGTLAPLNRLRIIYAFAAAIALLVFGIGAAVVASRWYGTYPNSTYHHSKNCLLKLLKKTNCLLLDAAIAAVIAFIGTAIYIAEAVARNRKSRII
jgi:hypothetical protein